CASPRERGHYTETERASTRLMTVLRLSSFTIALVAFACGGSPREATRPVVTPAPSTSEPASQGKLAEPEAPPAPRLLDIDWSTITLTSDADALALWRRIAPTGEDWEGKLEEIPDDGSIASSLAVTLLNGGNFTCATPQPPRDCPARVADIDAPAA